MYFTMPTLQRNAMFSKFGLLIMLFALILSMLIRGPYSITWFQGKSYVDEHDISEILGIDLGRNYSRIGIYRNSTFEIISDEQGRTAIPNYVAFQDNGSVLVGFEAQAQALANPRNTIYDYWRLMGQTFSDVETQEAIAELAYTIVDIHGDPAIEIVKDGDVVYYSPEEITTFVLNRLKIMAETYLNKTIGRVIITVPSHLNEIQKDATRKAADGAGLDLSRLITETMAISIGYRLYIRSSVKEVIYLLATEHGMTIISSDRGVLEIMGTIEARNSWWEESEAPPSTIKQLETDDYPPTNQFHVLIDQLLSDAKYEKKDFDGIVVVGGSTHLPELQGVLKSYFPDTEILIPADFAHDQAAVCGAAIQGQLLTGVNQDDAHYCSLSVDTTLLSVGIETTNGSFLRVIPRNWVIPRRNKIIMSTSSDNQENVVVRIFEGEREIACKNRLLGTLELSVSPNQLKGVPEIQVTFEVDANDILRVLLGKKGDWNTTNNVMVPRTLDRYTWEEIDHLVEEGEKFQKEDLQRLIEIPMSVPEGVELWESGVKEPAVVITYGFWERLFG